MPLIVRMQGPPRPGEVQTFADDVTHIAFGRDAALCQVLYPADMTMVGRQHFAMVREAGCYRFDVPSDHLVLVNGRPAIDGQELVGAADVQLGPNGPKLVLESTETSTLPPTAAQGHRAGPATLAQQSRRAANRGMRWALCACAIAIVAAATGYILWEQSKDLGDRVNMIGGRVTDVEQLSTTQKQTLTDLSDKFVAAAELAKQQPKLDATLAKAADSVYLVLTRNAQGNEFTSATAWVCDQAAGKLGTNAHVAESFSKLDEGTQLIVRSTSKPPRDFIVESAVLHPGYLKFDELWNNFDPVVRTGVETLESIGDAGPGCDVGVLTVTDPEGLGPVLPLADTEELSRLRPGYSVGYVGYPMEGLALGGANAKLPTPTTHMAYITAVTDYFGVNNGEIGSRWLVQHALPTAGGASGSPILNPAGQVVAIHSGSNVIGKTDSARIASGADIGFAQRIDLLRELLDGTAEQLQEPRTTEWNEMIARYYQPRKVVEHQVAIDRVPIDWKSQLERGVTSGIELAAVADFSGTLASDENDSTKSQVKQRFEVPQSGPCLIYAYSDAANTIELQITEVDGETPTRRHQARSVESWLAIAKFGLERPSTVEVVITSSDGAIPYSLHVMQAKQALVSPAEQEQALVAAWRSRLSERGLSDQDVECIWQTSQVLGTGDNNVGNLALNCELPAAGPYLVLLVAGGGEDVDLVVQSMLGSTPVPECEDRSLAAWAACDIQASVPEALSLLVAGPAPQIEVELRVYRARQRADAIPPPAPPS